MVRLYEAETMPTKPVELEPIARMLLTTLAPGAPPDTPPNSENSELADTAGSVHVKTRVAPLSTKVGVDEVPISTYCVPLNPYQSRRENGLLNVAVAPVAVDRNVT